MKNYMAEQMQEQETSTENTATRMNEADSTECGSAGSSPTLAFLFRIPTPVSLLIIFAFLVGPWVCVRQLGLPWGLIGIALIPCYHKIRYPGPMLCLMWLSMLDMAIIFGNAVLVIMGLVASISALLT